MTAQSVVTGWTHLFKASLVTDFHFGFIRNFSYAQQDLFGKNAADQYVPGIPNNPAIAGGVPLTQFANFGFLGSPDFLPKRQIPQQYQWSETISWTRGAHTFKFGGTLCAPIRNIFQDEPGTRGDLGFTGVFTGCHASAGVTCPPSSTKTGLSVLDEGLDKLHRLWNGSSLILRNADNASFGAKTASSPQRVDAENLSQSGNVFALRSCGPQTAALRTTGSMRLPHVTSRVERPDRLTRTLASRRGDGPSGI